jgi:2-haloacid dehalogenase
MHRPAWIVFDVNETLLDLAPVAAVVGEALGGGQESFRLWFSRLLHYSLVMNATGAKAGFAHIGAAALEMLAEEAGRPLPKGEAAAELAAAFAQTRPWPEVPAALAALKQRGYRLASLTNSSAGSAAARFAAAGISDCFDAQLSVEHAGCFKPHVGVYTWALAQIGAEPAGALMVAAHPWDLMGAAVAGLQTAFLRRPGQARFPLAERFSVEVDDLAGLATALS